VALENRITVKTEQKEFTAAQAALKSIPAKAFGFIASPAEQAALRRLQR